MIRRLQAPSDCDGLDELLLAQREHLAADDARDVGPVGEHDDRDHDRQAGLQRAAEAARPWSSTPTRGRGRAAAPGTRAGRRSRGRSPCPPSRGRSRRSCPSSRRCHRQAGADERDQQRHAGAVEDAREDVAPERVDAEAGARRSGPTAARSRRARRSTPRSAVGAPRSVADQRREDRHQDQQDDERERRRARPCPCGSGARRAAAATARPPAPCRRRSRRRRCPRRAADRWRLFPYSTR